VPFSAYQTFIIEKKYNFSNKTFDLFIYDLLVETGLMLIIFPPIIYGYLRVVELGGEHFYLYLEIFTLFITIVLTWIHPNLIAPLFN
jgi:STE24 endopeptidase